MTEKKRMGIRQKTAKRQSADDVWVQTQSVAEVMIARSSLVEVELDDAEG